jgi:hypothetical protein
MVFGLSSSKPKRLTSDHLPSANNLSQPARKKREPKFGRMKQGQAQPSFIWGNQRSLAGIVWEIRDFSTPLDMTPIKTGAAPS